MNLPPADDRLDALITAERAATGEPLDPARGIGWAMAIVLAMVVVGMLVALGVR